MTQRTTTTRFATHCLPLVLCGLLVASLQTACAADAAERASGARVVAVSDVHGAADGFEALLRAAGLTDAGGNWAGGTAQLVVTGDLLDRGADSRRAMDALMALEPQAEAAGGRVHVLLGNHEVMNLVGDLRYVACTCCSATTRS